ADAVVIGVDAVGQLGTDRNATNVTLDTEAELAGDVAAFTLAGGIRAREVVELFLVALVAQAHQRVRVPVTAFGDEVATQVERDAVLAPVQVLVAIDLRVLIVQLAVERPVLVEELAHTDRRKRSIAGIAVVVLDIHAGAAGDIPAVIEILRAGGTDQTQATQQGGAEELLIHPVSPCSSKLETAS